MLAEGISLYYVRHGETDWNLAQRYQGQKDIPLNATGRQQAACNGQTLRRELGARVGAVDYVASPLQRTRETMEIVRGAIGLPPQGYRTDTRLVEIHYGHWEGRLWHDLPESDPAGLAARKLDAWGWQPDGGESYRMLSDRIAGWLATVDRHAVVVAHGGVMRVLRGLVEGLDPQTILSLPVPQDKVLVVEAGGSRWL